MAEVSVITFAEFALPYRTKRNNESIGSAREKTITHNHSQLVLLICLSSLLSLLLPPSKLSSFLDSAVRTFFRYSVAGSIWGSVSMGIE